MDHMNFLGTTLKSIANEKLGIMKKNSITILARQKNVVKKLIRKEAKMKSNLAEKRSETGNQNEKAGSTIYCYLR